VADSPPAGTGRVPDPTAIYEAVERAVLGSGRTLNRVQVSEQAGVSLDRAIGLWQALGFPGTHSDELVFFLDADVDALRLVTRLVRAGFIHPDVERTLVRSMGRSFARLAEWEVSELAASGMTASMTGASADPRRIEEMLAELVPVIEQLHNYVWRRHVASAAGRFLLHPAAGEAVPMAVGFADIVGFTRRSRGLSQEGLAGLIESFESVSAAAVTENRGRVIKTIGDEVLFVTDAPEDAARIAFALVEARQHDEGFPQVRVGLAYGDVVSRLGDVFGPVVNVASRLTSVARPGRILLDRELSRVLKPRSEEFRVKRSRTTTVRGYSRLDSWSLKRPREAG
jgi:adenylate cyclase